MNDIWNDPPWGDGVAKYRLGLRPIPTSAWIKSDRPLLENKKHQLHIRYDKIVGEAAGFSAPDTSAWGLPWQAMDGYPHWIARLGAGIAEDVCLLDLAANHRLVAGCLAAPSYWSLKDKLGHPMHEVHEPVEGMNELIGDNIARFMSNIPIQEPFYRSNWFTHDNCDYFPEQSSHPQRPVAEWFIRSEQQVLFRPEPRYLLFTIRVVFAPLVEIVEHRSTIPGLIRALARMSEDEVAHFGGVEKHRHLSDYVNRL